MNNGADRKAYQLKLIGLGSFMNIEYKKYVILHFLSNHPVNTTDCAMNPKWRCQGSNSGPSSREFAALPLDHLGLTIVLV